VTNTAPVDRHAQGSIGFDTGSGGVYAHRRQVQIPGIRLAANRQQQV